MDLKALKTTLEEIKIVIQNESRKLDEVLSSTGSGASKRSALWLRLSIERIDDALRSSIEGLEEIG